MAAKIKEGMTGGQVADIIEQNFENLEDKFQQLSDQFDHTKEDINRTLDEYQSQIDDAYGSIAVQVDEEDTTSEKGKIKLKDRAYEPDKFSGKGYKILRKNIVCNTETGESKNILTQDMINEPNTVYEIRYDFDLNGETINIPEGCTLKFEGGSLSNGLVKNWQQPVFPEYFGAKGDGITDDSEAFKILSDSLYEDINNNRNFKFKNNIIELKSDKTYIVGETLFINPTTTIKGNNALLLPKQDNNFISYNSYKFMLCVGIDKSLEDISYEYASKSFIKDIRINRTDNYVSNLGFCLYGSSINIDNCNTVNLENLIYNFRQTKLTVYCDDMSLTNIKMFYAKDWLTEYDYTKPMIVKTCNGDGFFMKNIINESHHNLFTISGSTEGAVIESSLHVDGIVSGCSLTIISCHNERHRLFIFRSRVIIIDTTFVNKYDNASIAFNSDYQYGNSYLRLTNCIFYKDTFSINFDNPDIITNDNDLQNIQYENTWSVCRKSAVNLDDKYYTNNDFITIKTTQPIYTILKNQFIDIKHSDFTVNSVNKNNSTLATGNYTYQLYYYIPNLNIGIKYIIEAENINNQLLIIATTINRLPVYIERTHNSETKYAKLQFSNNGIYIDDGEYINGIKWQQTGVMSILDILSEGDKIIYDGINYCGYIKNSYILYKNNIKITPLNRYIYYGALSADTVYKIFKKSNITNFPFTCSIKSNAIDYTIYQENKTFNVNGDTYLNFKQDDNYIYVVTDRNYKNVIIEYNCNDVIPEGLENNKIPSVKDIQFENLSAIAINNKGIARLNTDSINKSLGYIYYNYDLRELLISNGTEFVTLDNYSKGLLRKGATDSRPIISNDTNKGFQYFDTTSNKPIWWTGTKWVDATGADV